MEWVETTAKTVEEAKAHALDQLGVHVDDAEFEVLEEPKSGLFGRVRGEARVRARVRPAAVRPKQERRGRGRPERPRRDGQNGQSGTGEQRSRGSSKSKQAAGKERPPQDTSTKSPAQPAHQGESTVEQQVSDATPEDVGAAAVEFMSRLVEAFGLEASTSLDVDGTDLDVKVDGPSLGLLVGPGGRTLIAIQDLARVASQRRLDDHETRLRVDVAGYRERRRDALERFTLAVANQVIESQQPKALEPMTSADRKIVHDAVMAIDGVGSRSEGDDPGRRVVIHPE